MQPSSLLAVGLGALALLAGVGLLWKLLRRQPTPEEIERRRRDHIQINGKIGDGEIIDVDGSIIMYCYSVGGVEYTVGQDVSALTAMLPEDRMRMVGPASLMYDPKNPPNSIVLCEVWNGLRLRPPA